MKKLFTLCLLILVCQHSVAQNSSVENKSWSRISKLAAEDFQISIDSELHPIKSQISLSLQVMGFSVFNKNFNKNVNNHFVRSASVINPKVPNIDQLVFYQQVNFDLAEVYARKMRKDLFVNRSKLWKGFESASQILNDNTSEFSRIQLLMDRDTAGGTDEVKVKVWKEMIDKELINNEQFDFDYSSKIKIDEISNTTDQNTWLQ